MRISDWSSDVCSSDLVLWIPSDGSTQILVTGQNSIYESAEFWPAVYRVDVTNGRKRIVERGRSSVLDWGADNRGQVRYAVGYRDHSTRSTLLYRSENDHGFKLIDTARLRDEDELDLPFQIGIASCRERGCCHFLISGVA